MTTIRRRAILLFLPLLAAAPCGRKQWPDVPAPAPAAPPPAERDVEEHTARPIQTDFPFQSSALGTRSPVGQIVNKSIAIRLGPDAAVSFDTDLLRMAAGWTGGFIEATGVTFDTTHGTHPSAGDVPHFTTAPVPGWADARGRFTDPRRVPFGPLAESWGRWDGLYVVGDGVVLSYTIQGTKIHEQPSAVRAADQVGFVRTFQLDPHDRPLALLVADVAGAAEEKREGKPAEPGGSGGALTLSVAGERTPQPPAREREGRKPRAARSRRRPCRFARSPRWRWRARRRGRASRRPARGASCCTCRAARSRPCST